MNDLPQSLNKPQRQAVLHTEGPLLVVAGAGAGKTKVITHRIAYLIKNGVKPGNILAVTFTNKAADEMKNRILRLTEHKASPNIGTFHSVCAKILRENSRAVGLPESYSILDKEDSLKTIKNSLRALDINPRQFNPVKIKNIISRQKSELVKLNDFANDASENFFEKTVASLWREYEKRLEKEKSVDFDDLITRAVFLFQDRPEILNKYQNTWRYILVDEYQDTNYAQYIFTRLVAQKHKNICVVGDEDQSIYKFRGANFGNILNFENDWPETKVIMLEQNYRSTQKILEAANSVIRQNKSRKPKNLFSELEKGNGLVIFDGLNEKEEADFVAAATEELIKNGTRPKEIAVLYRANFQSRNLEEGFLKRGVNYQVIGTKFFERKEVKDIIAYLKAALNAEDNLSLARIINEPPRGIGKASIINHISGKKLTADKKTKIENFFSFLKDAGQIAAKRPLSETLTWIIKESGYEDHLNDGSEEGVMRTDNLRELTALSSKYDSLTPTEAVEKFLEDIALMIDQDNLEENKNGVRLMTVHAAKGLEFPYVFITGLEQGLFPYTKPGQGVEDEEEERRLFYVAITRAKKQLTLSFAYSRIFFGGKQINKPSKFLNEIPEELFENFDIPTTNYLDM